MPRDVFADVTASIVAAIEKSPGSVSMPWHREGVLNIPTNVLSEKHYNGINIVSLWVSAQANAYSHALWGTYKQWQELGAQVRKGETSSLIIFYKELERENDEGEPEKIPMARASYVFNVAQVDGYAVEYEDHGPIDRIAHADAFVEKTGVRIVHEGAIACYKPFYDYIQMPDEGRFLPGEQRTEAYYGVLFHEMVHLTGHEQRLNRLTLTKFGTPEYAEEELVAELGAAFLCSQLRISAEPREDHAQYIAHWLEKLKNDKKFIFKAAAQAQKAVDYLNQLTKPA